MMTNISDVFAAGDMTKFPLFLADDEHINIQHWQMAIKQGMVLYFSLNCNTIQFYWCIIRAPPWCIIIYHIYIALFSYTISCSKVPYVQYKTYKRKMLK